MREALTSQLRSALDEAQAQARALNQDFVGAEHLVLGLTASESSDATKAVVLNEIDVGQFRRKLLEALPRAEADPVVSGNLPLSPKAKRAVGDALVRAQLAKETHVSSRFLLLALLEDPDSALRQTLRVIGADEDALRRLLERAPAQPEE